jgi:hypothetical protein
VKNPAYGLPEIALFLAFKAEGSLFPTSLFRPQTLSSLYQNIYELNLIAVHTSRPVPGCATFRDDQLEPPTLHVGMTFVRRG